jgi:outer membrane lipoprotein-sorting protein
MKSGLYAAVSIMIAGSFSLTHAGKSKIDLGEFSAIITTTTGGETHSGKTFVSKDRIRQENPRESRAGATIIRIDKGVTYVLMENKQYMEMAASDKQDLKFLEKETEEKFIVKSLGREKMNGYMCEKKQYIEKEKKSGVTTVWYSPKLKYMVKTEHELNGKVTFTMELTDIKPGKQPASLFEIPAGYTKFDPYSRMPANMREMMKGMIKGRVPQNMGGEE